MSTKPHGAEGLETFPAPSNEQVIVFDLPEFTCLCPKTGQPDFANFKLRYIPNEKAVESKSLKLYLWSFRDKGCFHEKVTETIYQDLLTALAPRWMQLVGEFNVRGGVYEKVAREWLSSEMLFGVTNVHSSKQKTLEYLVANHRIKILGARKTMTMPALSPAPEEVLEGEGACDLTNEEVADKVLAFAEIFSAIKLYTYQRLFAFRIVMSVLDNDGAIVTGLWARQCGKTETVASLALAMAVLLPSLAKAFPGDSRFRRFYKGFMIGIYAPIEKQSLLSFDRMRKTVNRPTSQDGMVVGAKEIMEDPELDIRVISSRGDTLSFSNGSVIIARTASPQSQIEGETHHIVICEEAQKLLRSKVEKEIRPMLASTNGTMVKIGTAWESRGGFHQSIQQNVDIQKTLGIRNHFEFPYDIVCAEKLRCYNEEAKAYKANPAENPAPNPFHLNYRKFVDSEITRLGGPGIGTETLEFKMNFRCLWNESRVIAITPDVLRSMEANDVEAGPRIGGFMVAGLDIAKTSDRTVLTLMEVDKSTPHLNRNYLPGADEDKQLYYSKTITDWVELQGTFEGNSGQYASLLNYLRQVTVQVLVVDITGMGDPVFERIQEMVGGDITCVPFRFSNAAVKSQLYKYYMQEIHAGRLRFANGPNTRATRYEHARFVKEHLDLDRQLHAGSVVYLAPEGEHDDYPDSAALACWGEKVSESSSMPVIQSSSAPQGWGGASRRTARSGDVFSSSSSMPTIEVSGGAGPLPSSSRAARYARRW